MRLAKVWGVSGDYCFRPRFVSYLWGMSFFKVGHSVGVAVAYWMAWTTGGGAGRTNKSGSCEFAIGMCFFPVVGRG